MSLAICGNSPPADVVKNLKDALVIIEKGDKKSDKAVEEVNKWLQMVKGIIYGQDGQEPHSEQVAQLAQETYNANVLPMLIRNLAKLDFESKKDVAQIFNNLLRRQIGTRSPTVEYLGARPEILIVLVYGYENGDIAVTCGSMLRECIRHDQLAKILLNHESFYKFFEYVEMSSFDIASDAYSTFKDLITKHKTLCAEFLDANYDKFFSEYQKLLNSENYVTRRQSLKLLGELLLDRHNFNVMTKYISNPENLKLMMELLREKGRSIQFEAFHVFKIFLANPDLPSELGDILLRNPEDLADYLQNFFQGNAGDLWPLEQLELCVDLIRLLPDDYSETLEVCEQDVMKAVSKILKTPPHRIDQRYKLAALGLAEAFTTKRGPLWFENDCQLLCLVAYLASAELRIILDNPGEISFNSLIICVDLLEMAIRAVDDEDFINDEDSLRISRAVQDASAFIVSHWVGAQEIETEKEKISQEVSELFYRYLCTLFSYGGEIFLQPEDIKKVTPLLVRIFHQFCVEKDIIMASALIKVLHAVKYDEKTALLLCDFLSITDPSEPDNSVINETIISIANLSIRCDWYDTETLSMLKTRAMLFTTEEKLHEVIKRI